jgi:hypothetical protein
MARGAPVTFAIFFLVYFLSTLFPIKFSHHGGLDSNHSELMAAATKEQQEHSGLGMLRISGESYGNSGGRFTSFVECFSNYHYAAKYFPGGSNLIMSATLTDNHSTSENIANGSWQLVLRTYGESSVVIKNGTFYSGEVIRQENGDPVAFILYGVEAIDTACGGEAPKLITIKASCTTPSPFYYVEENGDKIGSATPSSGHKIYYLFTHRMECI